VWRNQQLRANHQNGPGASPALWRNLLILHFDGIDRQFVTALDKRTGRVVWKVPRSGEMNPRPEYQKAYCTPLIAELGGRWQLISPAADWVYSYDPATGEELWKAAYGKLGFSTVPRPVAGHGMVYICTSFVRSRLLAIRYDGSGDVSDSHVAWTTDRQVPRMPSLLLVGNELYMVSDDGIATCLDAKTGEELWRERLPGGYSASPLLAAGRIYISNRDGLTTVLQPGREFQRLTANSLDGQIMASPAALDGALIYRTDSHLYRIESERAGAQ
jgi:outer membrane protein assembly factor BamB